LKIESIPQNDHQVKLVVEIDNETMEAAKRRAARKIAKRTKVPGFRPGKAPYPVIIRQFGEATIVEEAIDQLIEEQYPRIIEEAEIEPYGPGKLENVESLEPPVLEFIIPLKPVVDIRDSLSIRHPYEPSAIEEEDVDDILENLRERQAKIEPVDRTAEETDLVKIKIWAKDKDSSEESQLDIIPERTISAIIHSIENNTGDSGDNSEQETEWPFVGFSRNLIGMSRGDEKSVLNDYSDDDPEPFKNKNIEFNLVVEEIQSRTLPDIDDSFAEEFGGYPDLSAMRADILNNLEKQNIETYEEAYDDEILGEAITQSVFDYPPQALENEIDAVINNLKSNLERQNLDLELYKKTRDIDDEGLREEALPVAEERLKRSLFLYKIAEVEEIEVDDSQVHTEAQQTLNYLSQSLSYSEAKKLSNNNLIANLEWNIRADMITKLAMDHFRNVCKGEIAENEAGDLNTEQSELISTEDESFERKLSGDASNSLDDEQDTNSESVSELEETEE
jgi:trigger factor